MMFKGKPKASNRKEPSLGQVLNPYVKGAEGRKEWNDRYFEMSKQIKFWQVIAISLGLISLILAFTVSSMSGQSRIVPYIVAVKDGVPLMAEPATAGRVNGTEEIQYAINQFIINARTIVSDPNAQKQISNRAFAFVANSALKELNDYYSAANPFIQGASKTVTITINNSMPISSNTYQVLWTETTRDLTGQTTSQSSYTANIQYSTGKVNPQYLQDNPFGIYVTNFQWSENTNSTTQTQGVQ